MCLFCVRARSSLTEWRQADSELDALESQSCSTIFAALRESRTIPYDPSLHVCWMVRTTGALLGIAYAFTENK